jgi:hypothetical protein
VITPVIPPVTTTTAIPAATPSLSTRTSARQRNSPYKLSKSTFKSNHFANTAVNLDQDGNPLTYRSAINGPYASFWHTAEEEEIERLLDSNTIKFIPHSAKPKSRLSSYYNPQIKLKFKDGKPVYRVRGTYGGDRSDFVGETHAWTASLPTIKILLNAVVSEDANWMTIDLKDFYLNTEMERSEYMKLTRKQVPQSIIDKYQLEHLFVNNSIMVEIMKGIYGLPQAGKLAQDRLIKHLEANDYYLVKHTQCLFRHKTRDIAFTLVVDDFGIKYKTSSDSQHLIDTLQKLYVITIDPKGSKYVGLTIDYDKAGRKLEISMPGYIDKAMKRFNIPIPTHKTDSPILYTPPSYGNKDPQKPIEDHSPSLSESGISRLRSIVGVLLFYARAVDGTILTAVNKIGSRIETATDDTNTAADRLLHYCACYPDAKVTFIPSQMILALHSDASYLSEIKSRSRAGYVMYLTNPGDPTEQPINGAIDYASTIIGQVVSSASEAEYAALFISGQSAEPYRNVLEGLGYPQLGTAIVCDSSSAVDLVNHKTKQRKSKAIDMRYHWIQDRSDQGHFKVLWHPSKYNLADYFTKAHPVYHFQAMRQYFVAPMNLSPFEGVLSPGKGLNSKIATESVSSKT